MKSLKTTGLIALLIITMSSRSTIAQTKADITGNMPLTWLGVDYSQAKFIGSATNSSVGLTAWGGVKKTDNGVVSPEQFRDEFTVSWNQLFVDEYKKYDIAKATGRETVNFAMEVAQNANKKIKDPAKLFSDNPGDFKLTTEANIEAAVKGYDFGKNKGLGLVFFAGGMAKGLEKMGIWVTFVNMDTKTVLLTKYVEGKPGGFGFKNYWAKPIYLVVKEIKDDLKSWK
jgi:hypothetical protein